MRCVKTFGLLAVVVAATMASAAVASATTLTSPANTTYTGTIHAESEGTTTLHGPVDISCADSTVSGSVEAHGSSSTVEGNVGTLSFSSCNTHVTVKQAGRLIVHGVSPTGNGTLTSNGAKVTVQITGLISCEYETQNSHIGTITGSVNRGGATATLHIDSALIGRTGDSMLCGNFGEWTGSYIINSPMYLDIH